MKVQNKTIVVTGGGSGIGRELVLNFLNKGARVIAIDLNTLALKETCEAAGNKRKLLNTLVVDISDKKVVEEHVRKIISEYGAVDGLINNAGIIQPFVKLNELGYDAIERVLNVNFYGTLYMTKAFLPHFLTRPEAHMVNISSMGGFLPVPGQTIYGAAKAAVKLLTEGLNSELRDTNVRVSIVFPGAIATNIASNSGLADIVKKNAKPSSIKMLSAVKAAEQIVEGMERNQYRMLIGSDAKFMDFLYRLNPKYAAGFIYSKMKDLLSDK